MEIISVAVNADFVTAIKQNGLAVIAVFAVTLTALMALWVVSLALRRR